MKHINKIITLSLLTSSVLLGATPNIGDIERQVQPPKEVQQKQTPLIEINGVKKYAPTMKDDKSGKTIFVKNFKINGAIHIEESKLQSLISSYNGKDLTFTQLEEVTSVITKKYRNQGYFVARAYIPVQDINKNNGIFMIDIIEGNYGEFKLNNKSLVKDSVVQGMLDDAKARDNVVSTNTLERSMLIINDTPGVVVTQADVKPGSEVGSSDFIITTEKINRVNGYVLTDNVGSRYTGKNRLMAGLNINSPFDIGDKIALSGLVSNETNLLNGRVAYSAPLASNGLLGEISYSQTNYDLTKEYKDLDAQGTAKTIDATLKYPVIRTRSENLYVNLNVANKDLEDKVNSTNDVTKKDTQSLTIGTDYDKSYVVNNFDFLSKISFNVKYGKLNFDDVADKTTDENGADTNGNYSKVNLDLSNTIAFTNQISLDTALKMQYALGNKNLDGSEDISIGGSSGVKLYPDSESSAENGYVFNIEAKYKLPTFQNINNSVGIFYDRGRVWMANNNVGFETKALQDAGVGYYASYDKYFGQAQVAWNVNSKEVTSEPDRNSKILFQAGMTF
ncbi:ShlB/FhaC/HecB family hemolysin secretion/activation protein [Arcobacter caeni]|uniref:Hemin-binding protein n=1 Tax=Arcobacter caeni TaxID=1912877 RepID=A0A363D155_9BACT|nr:ShlB/FhaC/HecB family hemolysin secretion/activation protein [Arcobacter caeni]PUE65076.1 hemin-binding protein [Arcobacter caeni]